MDVQRKYVKGRTRLSRESVLRAAIGLVDEHGIGALSMRRLGQLLGVEAMSLYNHVANKDDLLDGMVDLVWGQIALPSAAGDWRAAVRESALSGYQVLLRHPWVCSLVTSRATPLPARLRYIEALLARLREAGFSAGLAYHGYHALDSHLIGFTLWEVGHSIPTGDLADLAAAFQREHAAAYPYLAEHAGQHVQRAGRDGDGEFAYVLDLILDGLDRAPRHPSATPPPGPG